MLQYLQYSILLSTTIYHYFATKKEDREQLPPGELIDIGGYRLHLYRKGKGNPTVILDHSLGGLDGYFLIDALAELTQVCIYDRPGYGWSDLPVLTSQNKTFLPRNSDNITIELEILLSQANIKPPYILIGDSFGSYNTRLYAHKHPDKVAGIIFVDGLHEAAMLELPLSLIGLKTLFFSGFIISFIGAFLGIIRVLNNCGIFEVIKPELNQFTPTIKQQVKRSFCRSRHWLTMAQEMWQLDNSGEYLKAANDLGEIPIINIKSKTFLRKNIFTWLLPLKSTNNLRHKIHHNLSLLSTNYSQINANHSSHFVWTDEPELIVNAVAAMLHSITK
jgi:pimeloyl-ACP methyl ester carboxylesterase